MRNQCPATPGGGQERWFFKITRNSWILFLVCFSLSQLFFFCCSYRPMLTQREPLRLTLLTLPLRHAQARPAHSLPPAAALLPSAVAPVPGGFEGPRSGHQRVSPGLSPLPGSRSGRSQEMCRKRKTNHKLMWLFPVYGKDFRSHFSGFPLCFSSEGVLTQ